MPRCWHLPKNNRCRVQRMLGSDTSPTIPRDVVDILGHYGYQTLVRFAEYEQIENISIGDSLAWQVVPNERGNLLFLKPIEQNAETNLTVVTSAPTADSATGVSQRIYVFSLRADRTDHHTSEQLTWTVEFRYPEDEIALINSQARARAATGKRGRGPGTERRSQCLELQLLLRRRGKPGAGEDLRQRHIHLLRVRPPHRHAGDLPGRHRKQNESLVNGVRQGKYVVVHRVGRQFTLRNGDVVTCIFNDAYETEPRLDQGSPTERQSAVSDRSRGRRTPSRERRARQ